MSGEPLSHYIIFHGWRNRCYQRFWLNRSNTYFDVPVWLWAFWLSYWNILCKKKKEKDKTSLPLCDLNFEIACFICQTFFLKCRPTRSTCGEFIHLGKWVLDRCDQCLTCTVYLAALLCVVPCGASYGFLWYRNLCRIWNKLTIIK